MKIKLRYIVLGLLMVLTVGCMKRVVDNQADATGTRTIYVFGDSNYDVQLAQGIHPTKIGPIAAAEVTEDFPKKYVEADGSYAGGRVYHSIEEAEKAVLEARANGLISDEAGGGIYMLQGDWVLDTYEYQPNDFRLKRSLQVLEKVK